jgi:4'-phosphopantetheinyl transferase EntD
VRLIGIDLELHQTGDDMLLAEEISPEGTPPGLEAVEGALMALSAKEAVFKSQFSLANQKLSFADVVLQWAESRRGLFVANVRLPELGLQVRSKRVGSWLLSAAISL